MAKSSRKAPGKTRTGSRSVKESASRVQISRFAGRALFLAKATHPAAAAPAAVVAPATAEAASVAGSATRRIPLFQNHVGIIKLQPAGILKIPVTQERDLRRVFALALAVAVEVASLQQQVARLGKQVRSGVEAVEGGAAEE
ncbi:unnamed protein product [Closterium sp. NIES-54]